MNVYRRRAVGAAVVVGILACGSGVVSTQLAEESSEMRGARSPDLVLQWNEIAMDTQVDAGTGPVPQVRFVTITQLAVFEAVNGITGKYEPYLGTVSAPDGASPEAAAVAAAHKVLVTYFSGKASALDAAYQTSLGTIPDGQAKNDGVAFGEAVANAMVALRANDGSSPAKTKVPGPAVPGEYQATASCPIGPSGAKEGSFYHWKDVTPFAVAGADFVARPPPELTSRRYARDYLEVLSVGGASSTARPQDRADVVRVYGQAGPAYLMNSATRQLALAAHGSLTENARNLALVNVAMSDAFLTTFANKYRYNFWRPETAIHAGGSDGNPATPGDPSFVPFITTPCYPDYPSNQGTLVNAAAGVLRRLYGERGHRINLSFPAVAGVTMTYSRLSQFTTDVADARVFGGIHFRSAQIEAERLGKKMARAVYGAVLRPVHGHHHDDSADEDDDELLDRGGWGDGTDSE